MRYEFRWELPGEGPPSVLELRITSLVGWVGIKSLLLNGKRLYRRGIFDGIDYRFTAGMTGPRLHLRALQPEPSGIWQPVLTESGTAIPEKLGTIPPPVARRPKFLAVTLGVAYLLIFVLIIMGLSIENILNAAYSPADSRVLILRVEDEAANMGLDLSPRPLPPAARGEPYEATLSAAGASPIGWRRASGRLPPGLLLDEATGTIRGIPQEAGDFPLSVVAVDAHETAGRQAYVIRVAGETRDERDAPRITTDALPVAHVGEPYEAALQATGGTPPYEWVCNSRKLPNGLSLRRLEPDGDTTTAPSNQGRWVIEGMPTAPLSDHPDSASESIAGAYPIRLRVTDAAYDVRDDTGPWVIPLFITAACMLGMWAMLRASVYFFAAAIVGEVIVHQLGWEPISMVAVACQCFVLLVGVIHIGRMR